MSTQTFQVENSKVTISVKIENCKNDEKESKIINNLPPNWRKINPVKEIFRRISLNSGFVFCGGKRGNNDFSDRYYLKLHNDSFYLTSDDKKFTNLQLHKSKCYCPRIDRYRNLKIYTSDTKTMVQLWPCWIPLTDIEGVCVLIGNIASRPEIFSNWDYVRDIQWNVPIDQFVKYFDFDIERLIKLKQEKKFSKI